FIDDILIASKDEAQHINHLKQIFQRLQDAGFVIKIAKCQILQSEVDFLRHHISVNGIEPSNERIKGKKSNDKNKIHWTEESVQAFENSKRQLFKATVLIHPSENARISLMVDVSDKGIGAVLQQLDHRSGNPLVSFQGN
ncbi:transposon Tf2-9 polyprotein, partial [Trichonephila clavipes]